MRHLRSELVSTKHHVQRTNGLFEQPVKVHNLGHEIEVVWADGDRRVWPHSRRGYVLEGLVPVATLAGEFSQAWADTEVGRQVIAVFTIEQEAA